MQELILTIPVSVTTQNGYVATINTIDVDSVDCFIGSVSVNGTVYNAMWDKNGTARDNDGSFNIDWNQAFNQHNVKELVDFVRKNCIW
ncbi:glycoside hydrolase family 92 protein [Vibrio cholerae]|nr:glycoside hydrolase family 92 protein [Vibrio cholerae]